MSLFFGYAIGVEYSLSRIPTGQTAQRIGCWFVEAEDQAEAMAISQAQIRQDNHWFDLDYQSADPRLILLREPEEKAAWLMRVEGGKLFPNDEGSWVYGVEDANLDLDAVIAWTRIRHHLFEISHDAGFSTEEIEYAAARPMYLKLAQ